MADMRLLLPLLYDNHVVQMGFAMIVAGVMIKAYIFPLHLWQPDCYTWAPSTISSMMASVHVKVMFYILIRLFFSVFTLKYIWHYIRFDILLCWLAAIAILVGSIWAIKQGNLKRMLAYSSISQMGYLLLGLGLSAFSVWGVLGLVAHILNHAVGKGCLFMSAGAFHQKEGIRLIKNCEGLGKRMPYSSAAFAIASASMIGIPPTAGFASKLFLIFASLQANQVQFAVVLLLSGLLNLIYFWRVIDKIYFVKHEETTKLEGATRGDVPITMLGPMLFLASLCLILGFFWLSDLPMQLINQILGNLRVGGSL
jgi:multicomponent Na+:H+ antiporter subunit D